MDGLYFDRPTTFGEGGHSADTTRVVTLSEFEAMVRAQDPKAVQWTSIVRTAYLDVPLEAPRREYEWAATHAMHAAQWRASALRWQTARQERRSGTAPPASLPEHEAKRDEDEGDSLDTFTRLD